MKGDASYLKELKNIYSSYNNNIFRCQDLVSSTKLGKEKSEFFKSKDGCVGQNDLKFSGRVTSGEAVLDRSRTCLTVVMFLLSVPGYLILR